MQHASKIATRTASACAIQVFFVSAIFASKAARLDGCASRESIPAVRAARALTRNWSQPERRWCPSEITETSMAWHVHTCRGPRPPAGMPTADAITTPMPKRAW
jgi:hypothetical protein